MAGSSKPLIVCLHVSRFCKLLSKKHTSLHDEYSRVSRKFTDSAIKIISAFDSDVLATLLLDKRDEFSNNAIEIALQSGNVKFLGCPKVAAAIERIWSTPRPINRQDYSNSFVKTIWESPLDFFFLPKAKYYWKTISYVAYVAYFTMCFLWEKLSEGNVDQTVLRFGFGLSLIFFIHEIFTIFDLRAKYFRPANISALPIYFLTTLLSIIALNVPYSQRSYNATAILPILIFLRLIQFLRPSLRFGALQVIFVSILWDAFVVLFLLAIILVGFTFSMTLVVGRYDVEGYKDIFSVAQSLIQAMFGQVDFERLDYIPGTIDRYAGKFIYLLFIIITLVLLLNVLIAILSTTFMRGYENSVESYYFGKAAIAWEFDSHHSRLVPPFSIISFCIYAFGRAWNLITQGSISQKLNSELVWNCTYCLGENNLDGEASHQSLVKRIDEIDQNDGSSAVIDAAGIIKHVLYPNPASCKNLCAYCHRVNPLAGTKLHLIQTYRLKIEYYCSLVTHLPIALFCSSLVYGSQILWNFVKNNFRYVSGSNRETEIRILKSLSQKSLIPSKEKLALSKFAFDCVSHKAAKSNSEGLQQNDQRMRFGNTISSHDKDDSKENKSSEELSSTLLNQQSDDNLKISKEVSVISEEKSNDVLLPKPNFSEVSPV